MIKNTSQKGFTLVEIVVALVLISILAIVASPHILSWAPNIQLKAAARNLSANMKRAKIEAIKRNANVVILIDTANCSGLPNTLPEPGGGYKIFVDDGAGIGGITKNNIQDGDEIIITEVTMPSRTALCSTTFTDSKTGFTSKGLPLNLSGTIEHKNKKNRTYSLSLTSAGGIRLSQQ